MPLDQHACTCNAFACPTLTLGRFKHNAHLRFLPAGRRIAQATATAAPNPEEIDLDLDNLEDADEQEEGAAAGIVRGEGGAGQMLEEEDPMFAPFKL